MKSMRWLAAAGLAMALSTPAAADTKAGVDAWARGDYKLAVTEWRGPAVAGDADAQFNLGQAYKLGRGVPVDLAMAEEWYRKAALQGHPQAQDNYGLSLFQNNKRADALPWLEQSVKRGEPRAQYILGTMLFNGDATARDWVRAYALMTRAAAADLPQAASTLAQMDRYISMSDRQKGTELARSYEREAGRAQLPDFSRPMARVDRPIATTTVPPSRIETPVPTVASRPAPPVAKPKIETPPAPPKPASAVVANGAWKLQLGAFGDAGNARRLGAQLAGRFPGRTVSYVKSGSLTRVLVGPYASNAEAARACGAVRPCVPTK